MQKKDYSIKAVIIGSGELYNEIINKLLLENAIVIASSSKYQEIDALKKRKVNHNSKIVTFLADISDYKKAAEFLHEIIGEYGEIDLGIGIFDSKSSLSNSLLVDMNCNEFERLVNNNIINYFLVCRILLHAMKSAKHGVCVTVNHLQGLAEKNKFHVPVLVSIIEKMQKKISEIFSNEVNELSSSSLKYYHLSTNQFSDKQKSGIDNISNYILDLYKKRN